MIFQWEIFVEWSLQGILSGGQVGSNQEETVDTDSLF